MISYPLLIDPHYDSKIWGGRRLETVLGKALPESGPIGESLESGDNAVVINGPLAGWTLKDLAAQQGASLLGTLGLEASQPFGDFPLLVKFIDASDILSLQVHPDDDGANDLGKRGKTEAWYIVEADPGSSLITGMSSPANAEDVRSSIEDGSFEELMERCLPMGGESLMVPAGTMHAIGQGILLYEVQQNCDVTFRLYDWGRVDALGNSRDLHLEQALRVLRPDRHAVSVQALRRDDWREILVACRYFVLERWQIHGAQSVDGTSGASFRLLSCIAGGVRIDSEQSETVEVSLGQTVLLPADLGTVVVEGDGTLLCSYVPDLEQDVVRPLVLIGYPTEQIRRLAGDTGDLDHFSGHDA